LAGILPNFHSCFNTVESVRESISVFEEAIDEMMATTGRNMGE